MAATLTRRSEKSKVLLTAPGRNPASDIANTLAGPSISSERILASVF
jgi:hypothetical protein